jgi:hypothetical protein
MDLICAQGARWVSLVVARQTKRLSALRPLDLEVVAVRTGHGARARVYRVHDLLVTTLTHGALRSSTAHVTTRARDPGAREVRFVDLGAGEPRDLRFLKMALLAFALLDAAVRRHLRAERRGLEQVVGAFVTVAIETFLFGVRAAIGFSVRVRVALRAQGCTRRDRRGSVTRAERQSQREREPRTTETHQRAPYGMYGAAFAPAPAGAFGPALPLQRLREMGFGSSPWHERHAASLDTLNV